MCNNYCSWAQRRQGDIRTDASMSDEAKEEECKKLDDRMSKFRERLAFTAELKSKTWRRSTMQGWVNNMEVPFWKVLFSSHSLSSFSLAYLITIICYAKNRRRRLRCCSSSCRRTYRAATKCCSWSCRSQIEFSGYESAYVFFFSRSCRLMTCAC